MSAPVAVHYVADDSEAMAATISLAMLPFPVDFHRP